MAEIPRHDFNTFANLYCDTQQCEPAQLLESLHIQLRSQQCTGWFMAEAQLLDSSWGGSRVIVAYGPRNTFKEIPTTPFSPRGLARDTSVPIAYLLAEDLPQEY